MEKNPPNHLRFVVCPIYWQLVGGFNPFEKYESKWESSPNSGMNLKKKLSCHHLHKVFLHVRRFLADIETINSILLLKLGGVMEAYGRVKGRYVDNTSLFWTPWAVHSGWYGRWPCHDEPGSQVPTKLQLHGEVDNDAGLMLRSSII